MSKKAGLPEAFASGIKRIVPNFLHAPLRKVWRKLYSLRYELAERKLQLSYRWHVLKGGSYIDWYSSTLDKWVESRDPAFLEAKRKALESSGAEDVLVLKSFGMQPKNTLHEFGCGQLRSALHFCEFLEPGNYSGNDSSKGRIDLGLDLFSDRIVPRKPTLIVNPDNGFDWLNGRKFDFIWCHAVFGHMPDEDIDYTIASVRKAMHAGTQFLFTYDEPSTHDPNYKGETRQIDARNFYQSFAFYRRLADKYGFQIEEVTHAIRPHKSYHSGFRLAVMKLAARQPA